MPQLYAWFKVHGSCPFLRTGFNRFSHACMVQSVRKLSIDIIWWTPINHLLAPGDPDLWPMTLIFKIGLDINRLHHHTKFCGPKSNGSGGRVLKVCWGTERNKQKTKNKKPTPSKFKGRALHWPNNNNVHAQSDVTVHAHKFFTILVTHGLIEPW